MIEMKIFEAFSGYVSQSLALKRLCNEYPEIRYDVVGFSEIDKYAIKAYNALHPDVQNYGDVTTIDWETVPDFDLLTWSSPCTNISQAGKQEGMDEGSGTASSFIWSIKDCLAVKHPKYILVENVANIVGKRFIDEFNKFQELLKGFGYVCHYNVMNAKDFGVPQNRKRLFLVARRSDMPVYYFPKPFPLKKRLKDVLEENVDESYYLSDKAVKYIFSSDTFKPKLNNEIDATVLGWVRDKNGNVVKRPEVEVANCVTAGKRDITQNYVVEQSIIEDFYANREPRQYSEYAPTLRSEREGLKVTDGIKIRRLIPRELYRLMDVDEEDIDILLDAGIPKTQQGKLAGNSIVVSCLYYIFRNMFVNAESDKGQQLTLF